MQAYPIYISKVDRWQGVHVQRKTYQNKLDKLIHNLICLLISSQNILVSYKLIFLYLILLSKYS